MLLTAVPHSSSLQAAERDISDFAYFSDLGRGREEERNYCSMDTKNE